MTPVYRNFLLYCISVFLILSPLWGCAGKSRRVAVPPPSPPVSRPPAEVIERGLASWYGHPYHGRRTANGEIYDMYKLTAAHRTLPLGTWVYVTNLENRKVVKVRINDRGPFIHGRIIDMSYTGAVALGFVNDGITRVTLSSAEPAPPLQLGGDRFAIQVGAFKIPENANNLKRRLEISYTEVYIERYYEFYRVRIGGYLSREAAEKEGRRLFAEGFSPFIIRQD